MNTELKDINQEMMASGMEPVAIGEEALVRRALLEEAPVPDAKEEFLRFKEMLETGDESHSLTPHPSSLTSHLSPLTSTLKYLLPLAACLLVAFLLFNKEKKAAVPVADEHEIYLAKEMKADDIDLKSGCKSFVYQVTPTENPVVNDISYNHINLDDYVESSATLTVPQGKVVRITLPDGSRVWLNAASRLVYPERFPANGVRLVKLEGEAYFQVAKDAAHPFVVDCGEVQTRVLGTQFNIRNFEGEQPCITLVKGSVNVSLTENTSSSPSSLLPPPSSKTLTPGQQATFNTQSLKFDIQEVDTEVYTAWREGQFYFDDQTLRDVMTEIGRWYNMNVIFEDLKYLDDRLHFNGDRSWTVQQTIDELRYIADCNVRIEGNNLIVY